MGSQEEKFTISEEEWQKRRLCPDESCIGVIGKNGRCKVCGLPADLPDPQVAAEAPPAVDAEPRVVAQSTGGPSVTEADGNAWSQRRLCSDGNCIGVIGSDGRCKECGKPYIGEPR